MSISHEEAHKLIQFKADGGLSPGPQAKLVAHLNECEDCRAYSIRLASIASILKTTLHKQWNKTSLPLPMDAIYGKTNSRWSTAAILTMRKTLIGAAFMFFAFMAWHSMVPRVTSQQYPSGTLPLIPTPSIQYSVTNTSQNECQNIIYRLQDGDTLEGIAKRFSVQAEAILLVNNMTSTTLTSIQEIVIPVCETTPTSTTYPPTFTSTPMFESGTTTPG